MTDDSRPGIVAWGRDEAATQNRLSELRAEAGERVREQYRTQLAEAHGLRKVVLWLRLQIEIRRVEKQVEDSVAPGTGLYLRV